MSGAKTLRYRLFGLAIESELALPELAPQTEATVQSPPDLSIRIADSSRSEEGGGYVLDIDKVARFTISDGRLIVIAPAAGAGEREIRLFLLGSAMGAALHQSGILPLHANAIAIDGRAVAFMGESGAGKSTLAAWFHDRGYPILADDVCVVRIDAGGAVIAYPGLPRLRLWEDALKASGRITADHSPSFHCTTDEREKYDVPIQPGGAAMEPLPLAAVLLLDKGPALAIEHLGGSRAVEAISANTYRGQLIEAIGNTKAHLETCVIIARSIPVLRLARPFDRGQFDDQCNEILNHLRSGLPSG